MKLLTVNETCEALRISRWTVARLIDDGRFTADKDPGRNGAVRIHAASLVALVHRHTVPAPSEEPRMSATVPILNTLDQVIEKTGRVLSLVVLQRALRAGKYEHVQFGRRRYMTDAQIEAMLAQLKHTGNQPSVEDPEAATRARLARMGVPWSRKSGSAA